MKMRSVSITGSLRTQAQDAKQTDWPRAGATLPEPQGAGMWVHGTCPLIEPRSHTAGRPKSPIK